MKPLVLYHAHCADGFTAAWVFWRHFQDGAEYRAVSYGEPAPVGDAKGRHVYVLDFCFPVEETEALAASASKFLVLDHHKTAQANF